MAKCKENIFNRLLELFFNIYIIHLLLLSEFVFVKVEAGLINGVLKESSSQVSDETSTIQLYEHSSLPLDRVNIKIIDDDNIISQINLKQVKRVLANENLPIWILNGKVDTNFIDDDVDGTELERNYNVMKQLGEFTTYHDIKTSSAAVYFHDRREFDGMINYESLILKLSVNTINPHGDTLLKLGEFGIYPRSEYNGHEDDFTLSDEDPEAGVNYQNHKKTYESRVYNGYPEILVIVAWDVVQDFIKHVDRSDLYETIVSYVLTLFNGVDMLYSKLQQTNIQINIAGIIIATEEESIAFLNDCYHERIYKEVNSKMLNIKCTIAKLVLYLDARKNKIPIDSYDVAIMLTRHQLIEMTEDDSDDDNSLSSDILLGFSRLIEHLYEYRQDDEETILVATITDYGNFENYPAIAHELAHSMTVYHDVPPFFTNSGQCCGKLLKLDGDYWCKSCLSWSVYSEESFKLFFSSPNCCTFINEPSSLCLPGRRQILTANEQCQCYGYMSAWNDNDDIFHGYCKVNLQCKNNINEFYRTVIPMDGTPCGNNKVCWERSCQEIELYTNSDSHIDKL